MPRQLRSSGNILTGDEVDRIDGYHDAISSVAVSPDERFLAIASDYSELSIYDLRAGGVVTKARTSGASLFQVVWSPVCPEFAIAAVAGWGSRDHALSVWNLDGSVKWELLGDNAPTSWCVAYSPDGKLLAGGADGSVTVWRTDDASVVGKVEGMRGCVNAIAFSNSGEKLVCGSDSPSVSVLRTELIVNAPAQDHIERHIVDVRLSVDEGLAAVARQNGVVEIWDLESAEIRGAFVVTTNDLRSISLSPNGKRLATWCHGNEVAIWEFPELRFVTYLTIPSGSEPREWLKFVPNEDMIVSAFGSGTTGWDSSSGECLWSDPCDSEDAPWNQPDEGPNYACVDEGVESVIKSLEHDVTLNYLPDRLNHAVFTFDGKMLVGADGDCFRILRYHQKIA